MLRIGFISAILLGSTAVARANLAFTEWGMSVDVRDSSSAVGDVAIFYNPPVPFQGAHTASVGNLSSSAQYLFDWSPQQASFSVAAAQVTEDLGPLPLWARSSGTFFLETQDDVHLVTSGSYTYNTPATYFDVTLKLLVTRVDPWEVIWGAIEHGGPFAGHPPPGVLSFGGSATIPGGDPYRIAYTMEVHTFGGGTGVLGTGAGEINFELHSVPEPATAALLLLAAALGFPRRLPHRRISKHSIPHY